MVINFEYDDEQESIKELKKIKKGFFGRKKKDKDSDEDKGEVAKKVLGDVEDTVGFKIKGKEPLLNMESLRDYLKTLDDDSFDKIVNKKDNDVAWWVTNTLGDEVLGEHLEKMKDSKQMTDEISTRIKELTPYLKGKKEKDEDDDKDDEEDEKKSKKKKSKKKKDDDKEKDKKVKKKSKKKKKDDDEDKKKDDDDDKEDKKVKKKKKKTKKKEEEKEDDEEDEEDDEDEEDEDKEVKKEKKSDDEEEEDDDEDKEKEKKSKDDEDSDEDEEKPKKAKSVAELLAEEGIVATESEARGEEDDKDKPKSIDDVLMIIEKINGKLEVIDQFRNSSDQRVGDLGERIGELRQMLLDKERDFNDVQSGFEKMNDTIGDINPIEINKQLEKSKQELEKRDVKIETLENKISAMSKELVDYRKRMNKIKDFDALVEMLNKLKEQVVEIQDTSKYSKRLSAKIEHVFSEMNDKVMLFKGQLAKIDQTDESTQDLLISVDKLNALQDKYASKDDLDKFRKNMQKQKFGITKEGFVKVVHALEKEMSKMKDSMSKIEYKSRNVTDLIDERVLSKKYIEKIGLDYKKKKISEDTYLEAVGKAKRRNDEIEKALKRINTEKLYLELNKISKVVNDHAVLMKTAVTEEQFKKLKRDVSVLGSNVDREGVDRSLAILEDAKTNIFNRLATAEKDIADSDLKVKEITQIITGLSSLKKDYNDFEKLVAGNISDIDTVKGILGSIENKMEGDFRQRLIRAEASVESQQHEVTQRLKLVKDEVNLEVRDKLKMVNLFSEEIRALKDGKSMMFDKLNSNESTLEALNLALSGLRGELRILAPKLSSIENNINGSMLPDMVSVKSKVSDFELLQSDLGSLKLRVGEIFSLDSAQRFEELASQLKDIKRELYGG
ncbi:hypothetical protein KAS08_02125 [Candidatus Pacearchaeota archaeon]|nr:hypothetical protein [Candidatus Pacearchaeota archaeon]